MRLDIRTLRKLSTIDACKVLDAAAVEAEKRIDLGDERGGTRQIKRIAQLHKELALEQEWGDE